MSEVGLIFALDAVMKFQSFSREGEARGAVNWNEPSVLVILFRIMLARKLLWSGFFFIVVCVFERKMKHKYSGLGC